MRCEEEGINCPNEAVGQDIRGSNLCRDHLAFSVMVQRLCNAALDDAGRPDLVPLEYRFPRDFESNN